MYELILCIVNAGFSEVVMDAAYDCGARGGTVIQARGTANQEAEKVFGITIQPEKEILMLVVPSELRDSILHALYKSVGLNSPGHGIAFALPISNVLGLKKTENSDMGSEKPNNSTETKTEKTNDSAENSAEKEIEKSGEESENDGEHADSLSET